MEEKMVNLGELFREAKRGQKFKKTPKIASKKKNKVKPKKMERRKSGIYGVGKINNRYSQKTPVSYRYTYNKENGKQTTIQRKTLMLLYDAIQDMGYDFVASDKDKAYRFISNECQNEEERDFLLNKIL